MREALEEAKESLKEQKSYNKEQIRKIKNRKTNQIEIIIVIEKTLRKDGYAIKYRNLAGVTIKQIVEKGFIRFKPNQYDYRSLENIKFEKDSYTHLELEEIEKSQNTIKEFQRKRALKHS